MGVIQPEHQSEARRRIQVDPNHCRDAEGHPTKRRSGVLPESAETVAVPKLELLSNAVRNIPLCILAELSTKRQAQARPQDIAQAALSSRTTTKIAGSALARSKQPFPGVATRKASRYSGASHNNALRDVNRKQMCPIIAILKRSGNLHCKSSQSFLPEGRPKQVHRMSHKLHCRAASKKEQRKRRCALCRL